MQEKPYFCPNCRSNRTKFRVLFTTSQSFVKEPVTGSIHDMNEPVMIEESEPTIGCLVCGFTGNEMRFVKQAEREPRPMTPTNPAYR
ncbi:hypothetical protein [Paenibacillus flagellatus]|uniref:DNA alkylation repair protein n=1 Tax=Paenibacillus flagellatus TaxID=2211139 RepID=A0A2V5JYK6_9BACL|nr:hypothetical protein [Paenibacillus flagellatus]PYI50354.1 hypothetical protein DLM86_29350 [Paenibacillus flagellatus]